MTPQLKLVVLLTLATYLAQGSAQQCYNCTSLSSSGLDNLNIPGYSAACSAENTVDCSAEGGCSRVEFILYYTSTTLGEVSITTESRGCGANADLCIGKDDLSDILDSLGGTYTILLDLSYPDAGLNFTRADGSSCLCTGNLCNSGTGNDATVTTNSGVRVRAPILCSLILALASVVFARLP